VRASEEEDVFHFVANVPRGAGRVYELDGLAAAPVDHLGAGGDGSGGCSGGGCSGGGGGVYDSGWTAVAASAIQACIARYSDVEIKFNLLALCADDLLRTVPRDAGPRWALPSPPASRPTTARQPPPPAAPVPPAGVLAESCCGARHVDCRHAGLGAAATAGACAAS
jgi:hypothetical protein